MRQRKEKIASAMELKFKYDKTILRNKDIFDIQLIRTIQEQEQLQRRIPTSQICTENVQEKLGNTFLSTTAQLTTKCQQDIYQRQTKAKFDHYLEERGYHSEGKHRGKRISFAMMIPRKENVSRCLDQRRFNNYSLRKPNLSKTRSFQEYLPRKAQLTNPFSIGSSPDHPQSKIRTPSFKNQQDRKDLSLYPKFSSFFMHDLNPENLHAGQNVIHFDHSKCLNELDKFCSREAEPQLSRIFYSPNCRSHQKQPKQKKDAGEIRFKTTKQRPKFRREEVCDLKFFRLERGKDKNKRAITYV